LQDTPSRIPRATRYDPGLGKVFMEGAELISDDKDMFLVVEKFAYGNGTQPVPFGNGTRPDIPLVSLPFFRVHWCFSLCAFSFQLRSFLFYLQAQDTADASILVLSYKQLYMARIRDTRSV
jgi:hypothetical protein